MKNGLIYFTEYVTVVWYSISKLVDNSFLVKGNFIEIEVNENVADTFSEAEEILKNYADKLSLDNNEKTKTSLYNLYVKV